MVLVQPGADLESNLATPLSQMGKKRKEEKKRQRAKIGPLKFPLDFF